MISELMSVVFLKGKVGDGKLLRKKKKKVFFYIIDLIKNDTNYVIKIMNIVKTSTNLFRFEIFVPLA